MNLLLEIFNILPTVALRFGIGNYLHYEIILLRFLKLRVMEAFMENLTQKSIMLL